MNDAQEQGFMTLAIWCKSHAQVLITDKIILKCWTDIPRCCDAAESTGVACDFEVTRVE